MSAHRGWSDISTCCRRRSVVDKRDSRERTMCLLSPSVAGPTLLPANHSVNFIPLI